MVIWTFIWFVGYLLQLQVKINMLACMGLAVNLFCYILGKAAVYFIQNLSLNFQSFSDI